MAEPKTENIAAYGAYLKAKGASDENIHAYTKYLADHHDVSHPSDNPSWIDTAVKAVKSVSVEPVEAAVYAAQKGESPLQAYKNQFANMNQEGPSGHDIAHQAGFSENRKLLNTAEQQRQFDMIHNPGVVSSKKYQDEYTYSPAQVAGVAADISLDPLNLVGPGLGQAGKVTKFVAGPVSKGLESFAAGRALKAAGLVKDDFTLINAKGMHDAFGNLLLDHKLVTPLSTVNKISSRIRGAQESAGQTIGHILDTGDTIAAKAPPISARDIALNLSEDPEIMLLGKTPGQEKTANQINGYLNTLYSNGEGMSLREAHKLRQSIESSIKYNKELPEMKEAMPYLYKMRDSISKAMNESIKTLPSGGELDKLKEANDAYNKLSQLDKITQNRIGSLSPDKHTSLAGKIVSGIKIATGDPIEAISLANKAARTFGNSLTATSAKGLSKTVSNIPETISSASKAIVPARAAISTGKGLVPEDKNVPGYNEGGTVVQKPPVPDPNIDNQKIKTAQASMRKAFGFASGGVVPGTPKLPVDSPKNDDTLIKATPGEVVLPLSVTQSSNPPQRAKEFMENQMGPDKWANDGLQNLRSHVGDEDREMIDEHVGKMMIHPKMKNLLITASKFQPGSQPLDQIFKHIKGHLGMEE